MNKKDDENSIDNLSEVGADKQEEEQDEEEEEAEEDFNMKMLDKYHGDSNPDNTTV